MAYTELCGSKLRSKLGSFMNESKSAPTSSFAKKQLEKMGWNEGQGLGREAQGISTHIRVKKREEHQGIGQEKVVQKDAQNTWWADSLGDTLSKLNPKKKKKRKRYTDEELFEATGGARFGMRAQRKAQAKWKRTEEKNEITEEQLKEKMEWNGLGEAQVVGVEKKKRRQDYDLTEKSSPKKSKKESKKKKKKKEKKENDTEELTIEEDSAQTDTSNEHKAKKKESNESKENSDVSKDRKKKKKKRTKESKETSTHLVSS